MSPMQPDEGGDSEDKFASQDAEKSEVPQQPAASDRSEKLKAVRQMIASGGYDSEEILDVAMQRLLAAIQNKQTDHSVWQDKRQSDSL
jgi:anti-sigma28 factor (negative regulator of flagellin synthesis)